MTQQTFLNHAQMWDTLHVSGHFVSNGVVAVQITNIDPASTRLALLVHRYSDPAKLAAAHVLTRIPAINNLPPCLVFAPANWEPSRLDQEPDGLFLVDEYLYETITGHRLVTNDFWNYRCLWDNSAGEEPVPVVMVYDVDMELFGFCCGLKVGDGNRDAVLTALRAALQEPPDA